MDDLAQLLHILEVRAYAPAIGGRDCAAKMAAIANLPIGWLFEEPRRDMGMLMLRASGPGGDEIEVAGPDAPQAWLAMVGTEGKRFRERPGR
jgi:hypothetical protein